MPLGDPAASDPQIQGYSLTVKRSAPGIQIAFSAPFVAGNVINLAVNGAAIVPVDFTTDSATTLGLLATAIAAMTGVTSAVVSGAGIIVQDPASVAITGIAVTSGASQPTASLSGCTVNGAWVPAVPTTFSLTALVQPMSLLHQERMLLLLPEGIRTKALVKIISPIALLTAGEAQGQIADLVTWNGVDYQVQQVTDWSLSALPHWEIFAAKVDQQS